MIQCNKCSEFKPQNSFYKHLRSCKKCNIRHVVNKRCPIRHNQINSSWYKNNKAKVRKSNLMYLYGIKEEEYYALLAKQEGKCAVCSLTHSGDNKKPLFIDHDHKTGKIRGLLCRNHNLTLGLVKDDPETLQLLIRYLAGEDR